MAEIAQLSRPEQHGIPLRLRSGLRTHAHQAGVLAVFVLAGWFVFSWFQTINHILRDYTPVPRWDYWSTASHLRFYRAFDLRVLWMQHNDHRIVFPEIVFATDLLLLHGRQLLPIALSLLCYFGNWVVLGWAFWSVESIPKSLRTAAVLLAGVLIGWQGSAFNIADSFLLQWTLTQIAALLSLAFLVRLQETLNRRYLAGAILSSVVATYSSANGLMLWPVLIAAALVLSLRRTEIFALLAAAVLSIGLYFVGFKFSGTLSLKHLLLHPIYLVQFVGCYLSMPFGALKSPRFGMHLGVTAMCLVLCIAFLAFRSRFLHSRAGIVLFGFYAFIALTALLTAAGRMNPTDPGFVAAKALRYVSGPFVAWGVFILLCIWFSSRWRRAAGYAAALMFGVLLLLALPKLRWWMQAQETQFTRAQLAALAMEQGIYDPSTILGVFPDPISPELWSKDLRDNHLSVFYKGHAKWFGRPAEQFAQKVNAVVPGQVTYTLPVRDGLEVAGWFDTSDTNFRHVQWLLFANEAGQIVGFGRKLPAGLPDSIDSPHIPRSLAWAGFINLKYPVKTFTTFVIDKRGLVRLEGCSSVPQEEVVDRQHAGARIPGIQWHMDPGWTAKDLPADWKFGYGPPAPVYASGNDTNTGQLTSSVFARPDDGCIIVPVLQGPTGSALSAAVVDAATNRPIAHAWFDSGPNAWKFWRIKIPPDTTQLRIVAEDKGNGWGEWLAVGNPSRCQ